MKKMNGLGKFSFALILSLIMCLGLFSVSAFAADDSLQDGNIQGVVQEDSSQDGTGQAGTAQQGESQTGAAQDGSTQQGEDQTGATQDGSTQQGEDQTGATQDGSTQQGEDQTGATQDGSTQQGEDQTGATQDGSTQQGEDQTGAAQDGSTQQGEDQTGASQDGSTQQGENQNGANPMALNEESSDVTGSVSVSTYAELQEAIKNASNNPTTIIINQTFSLTDHVWITEGKNITLVRENDAVLERNEAAQGSICVSGNLTLEDIILDGKNVASPFALLYIMESGEVMMNSGEIRNGNSSYGGGVYNAGTLTMTDGTISGNTAKYYGGGVHNSGTFTVKGGSITGNEATDTSYGYGGGVYNAGTLTMDDGTISGNTAKYYAGGVYNSGTLTMNDGKISGNTGNFYGGGVYNPGTFTMNGGEISGNKTIWYGGGVHNSGTFTVNGGSITGNEASNTSYGYGGGVYNSGTLKVTDAVISGNKAAKYGGGVYSTTAVNMKGATISDNVNGGLEIGGANLDTSEGTFTLTDLTITGNTGNRPALLVFSLADWTITDCEITGNVNTNGSVVELKLTDWTISQQTAAENSQRVLNSCTISNNKSSNYDGAALKVICGVGETRIINCIITENEGQNGGLYNSGSNGQTIIGEGTRIEGNIGTTTGGIHNQCSSNRTVGCLTIDGAVIKGNSGGTTGGVYTAGVSFAFKSGALYDNTGRVADDFYAGGMSRTYSLIKASEMYDDAEHPELFSKGEYIWAGGMYGTEDTAFVNAKDEVKLKAIRGVTRYVAQIGEVKYETLEAAIKAARNGDTIQFVLGLGDDEIFGNEFSVSEAITIDKEVTIVLNNQSIFAAGKDVFLVVENGKLTLQGAAMVDGQFIVNGGSLAMDGSIMPYTYSDGKVTKKDLVINVEKDSSFTINGTVPYVAHANPLQVKLAQDTYITAGEGFAVNSKNGIKVILPGEVVNKFNAASGSDELDDIMFIQGLNDADLLSKITCEGVASGLVQVKVIDGDIVLHKAVLEKGVYLNGLSGSDSKDGMTTGDAVKTLNKAMAIAKENGLNTIYVTGEVTVNSDVDGNGITLMRYPTNLGHLLIAANLTLSNITLDGASELGVTSGKSLLLAKSGKVVLGEGVTLQNNDVSANTTYPWNYGGGVYVSGGATLEMEDGAVIENCTALFGGGVAANGTFTMNGGEIRYCNAVNTSGGGYGGGVVIFTNNGRMTMYDGTIHHNTAAANGGGIAQPTTSGYGYANAYKNGQGLTIIGGTISDNVAMSSGGGIYIQCENKAVIGSENPDPDHMVRITGNEAFGHAVNGFNNSLYAGGGIYVNGSKQGHDNGILQLYRVVVTQNTAENKGNGLGACPTGQLEIYLSNGGAFYGNTGSAHDDLYMIGDASVMGPVTPTTKGTYFFLSPTMLGGGASNWKRTANDIGGDLNMMEGYGASMQYYSDCTQESMDAALAEAGVLIEGNISHENGGGIGTNGTVTIGTQSDFTGIEISVTKLWDDEGFELNRPNYIDAVIYRTVNGKMRAVPVGEEFGTLRIYSLDAEGTEWPTVTYSHLPKADSNGNPYTYYVHEVVYGDYSYLADIIQNSNSGDNVSFTITNRPAGTLVIKKALSGDVSGAANKDFTFTVSGPNGYSEIVTITGAGEAVLRGLEDGSYTVMETGDTDIAGCDWSVEGNNVTVDVQAGLTSDVTVTNIYTIIRYTSLTVNKVWVGDTEDTRPSSVTVQCYHDDEAYGDPVTLNAANAWTYTWSNLNDAFTWTVRELNVPEGYTSAVSQEGTTFTITNTYTPEETPPPTPETPPTTPDRPHSDRPTTPEEPPVDIPDPDVPLSPAPPEEEPPVIIEEPDVPLAELPPEVDIPDVDVPLVSTPPTTTIPDPDVPLADVPRTGDASAVWSLLTAAAVCGLAVLNTRRKEEER